MIKNFLKNNPIHKKVVPYLDCFFLIMPTSFFIAWPLLCFGMYIPMFLEDNIQLFVSNISLNTFLLFVAYSLMISSISMIYQAQIFTNVNIVENKLINENKINYTLSILSIIIFFYLSIKLFFISIFIFFISNFLFYCKKNKQHWYPIFWFTSVFILCFLLIIIGSIYQLSIENQSTELFNYNLIIICLPYVLSFFGILIMQDVIHSKKNHKDNTFSNYLSINISSLIALFLVISSLLISLKIEDPLSSTSIVVFLTFFLYALFRAENKDYVRALRYPIGIHNFFIMTIFPYLFLPSFILFYLSKYYYWHRYNIHYPTFLVEND